MKTCAVIWLKAAIVQRTVILLFQSSSTKQSSVIATRVIFLSKKNCETLRFQLFMKTTRVFAAVGPRIGNEKVISKNHEHAADFKRL